MHLETAPGLRAGKPDALRKLNQSNRPKRRYMSPRHMDPRQMNPKDDDSSAYEREDIVVHAQTCEWREETFAGDF